MLHNYFSLNYLFYVRFSTCKSCKYRNFFIYLFFLKFDSPSPVPLLARLASFRRHLSDCATTLQNVPLHWTSDFLISLPAAHCRERKGNGVAFIYLCTFSHTSNNKKATSTTPTFRHSPKLDTIHHCLLPFEFECQFPLYRNLIVHHGIYVLICLISSRMRRRHRAKVCVVNSRCGNCLRKWT